MYAILNDLERKQTKLKNTEKLQEALMPPKQKYRGIKTILKGVKIKLNITSLC